MKRLLFVFAIALAACNSESKNKYNNNKTVSVVQKLILLKKIL